jgi:hypothetical protein
MDNQPITFEAVVAVYGVSDDDFLTEQQAMGVYDLLRSKNFFREIETPDGKRYSLINSYIEGDREQGRVFAAVEGR